MEDIKVIISYESFKELERQNKEMRELLLKIAKENNIEAIKDLIIDFNTITKKLWV